MPHLFQQVLRNQQSVALVGEQHWTYGQLLRHALQLRDQIAPLIERNKAPHIAFLGGRDASYIVTQWAIWLSGGVCVPLHPKHPTEEIQYILDDSCAQLFIADESFVQDEHLRPLLLDKKSSTPVRLHKLLSDDHSPPTLDDGEQQEIQAYVERLNPDEENAHIIYTSGTTGRPKGVVTSHAGLTSQILDIVSSWKMNPKDHLLHFLPLHHVHGVLNNLLCVMYAGGSVRFLPSATPRAIWDALATDERQVTMLMAVPTIYMNLLEYMEPLLQDPSDSTKISLQAAKNLRVAISGSMACPVSILERWEKLTGHRLLERYGMSELGMVLTNPLEGEKHVGFVGQPFPSVKVRLMDPDTERPIDIKSEEEGELRVKGTSVFKEYWNKPDATKKEFDADGWFKTGDIAQFIKEKNSFRLRGRASADILKSAGYKISALDIERVLLTHDNVAECAVFGIADEKWGQVVSAVLRVNKSMEEEELKNFAKEHLASYRVPRKYFFVETIPKNAMGKVNKKELAKTFAAK